MTNGEIEVLGNVEIWSDDPEGWQFRIYTENRERQKQLEKMNLKLVGIYWFKGKLVGKDYRANQSVVDTLRQAMKKVEILQ